MPQSDQAPNRVFSGDTYQILRQDHGSDLLVISFAERKEPKPAEFFATKFLDKEKISYLAVRSLSNDWYLSDEMTIVFKILKRQIDEIPHKKLYLTGYSMGSFGAVRSASTLNPDRLILSGPIVSLERSIETRWLSDYRHLYDRYQELAPSIFPLGMSNLECVALYDPECDDATHVDILEESTTVTKIHIHHAGHMVLAYLRTSGILGDVMRNALSKQPNPKNLEHKIHSARKTNGAYLLKLSSSLNRRPKLKDRVLSFAVKQLPGDISVALALAEFKASQGHLEHSHQIIREIFSTHGTNSFGVPLAKALASFCENGGAYAAISDIANMYKSPRGRSRETQLWYSRFLRHAKKFDEAFLSHEPYMTGDPFEAHAHIERGLIYEAHNLNYPALKSFQAAEELSPSFKPISQHIQRINKKIS